MAHYIYLPSQAYDHAVLVGPFLTEEARHDWIKGHEGELVNMNPNWHTISLPSATLPVVVPEAPLPTDY